MKMMSVIVPLSTLAILYFVLTRVAELDATIALVAGVVFGAMEWLFLGGIVRKRENADKTIG
jgi:4-amino-4-deoxy-L-arabinose transferase-like glycosyltransferase